MQAIRNALWSRRSQPPQPPPQVPAQAPAPRQDSAEDDDAPAREPVPVRIARMAPSDPSPVRFTPDDDDARRSAPPTCEPVAGVEGAFLIRSLLTPDECQQFIRLSEEHGYDPALVTTQLGMVHLPNVRNNFRMIWEVNDAVLRPLWRRAAPFIPPTVFDDQWRVCEERPLNERLRLYRYDADERFEPHYDGCYPRVMGREQSHLTFIVYLNGDDGLDGGETAFYVDPHGPRHSLRTEGKRRILVSPRCGTALVFYHTGKWSPLHEGTPPRAGRKYVLRTDVMYEKRRE